MIKVWNIKNCAIKKEWISKKSCQSNFILHILHISQKLDVVEKDPNLQQGLNHLMTANSVLLGLQGIVRNMLDVFSQQNKNSILLQCVDDKNRVQALGVYSEKQGKYTRSTSKSPKILRLTP